MKKKTMFLDQSDAQELLALLKKRDNKVVKLSVSEETKLDIYLTDLRSRYVYKSAFDRLISSGNQEVLLLLAKNSYLSIPQMNKILLSGTFSKALATFKEEVMKTMYQQKRMSGGKYKEFSKQLDKKRNLNFEPA